jgi:hypothetical protein
MNGEHSHGAKGHHRVEIKGASIGPAAGRARKSCHHGLAGRIPMICLATGTAIQECAGG